MSSPKLFISYSWSSPSHVEWVLALATRLCESGVDVILDKWDLKEGQDTFVFMEKMVNDPEINKVAIITDSTYVEKADSRDGGAGVEAQIISTEMYSRHKQNKFVAVIAELDKNGKPYLPAYYKRRVYINMSDHGTSSENFEQLLRWIYDKPFHVKPDIGPRPTFLDEQDNTLGTTFANKKAIAALKDHKQHAAADIEDYLSILSENLEKFRITKNAEEDIVDSVLKSIDNFAPYRDEAVSLFSTVARYAPTEDNIQILHKFFESLIHYANWWAQTSEFDNFRFIIHELFLCWVAALLKRERFATADAFLRKIFYQDIGRSHNYGVTADYCLFASPIMPSLEEMGRRKKRLCFEADLLKKRANSPTLEFRHLMQADFALYIRGEVLHRDDDNHRSPWYPITSMYTTVDLPRAFEIFARSASKEYFERSKQILGISKKEDLLGVISRSGEVRWKGRSIDSSWLLGYKYLATSP